MSPRLNRSKVLVTGGAGFIGSHLVDALVSRGAEVTILDNLSSGKIDNISHHLRKSTVKFIKGDLLNPQDIELAVNDCEIIFHLAANPDVREGSSNPQSHFNQNVVATYNLLEVLRRKSEVRVLAFTSSSTVYGEAPTPTPEDCGELKPISVYGATKLACEALISAYAHSYGFRAVIYRLANIIGSRSTHGVIVDFIKKLSKNPSELEILGDGTQKKSYLHVSDCIDAMLLAIEKISNEVEIFNIGSEDQVDVLTIAKIVVGEMGLKDVKFRLTGGVDGGRGWVGDVKNMLLDVSRLKKLGWKPRYNSAEAVRQVVKEILTS